MILPTQLLQDATNNPWVRYALILLVGITIGAVFYPTKKMKETISKQYEQQIQTINDQHKEEIQTISSIYNRTISEQTDMQEQYSTKITQLTTEVSDLQSHKTTNHYKIVHPDGTVEERDSTEADVDENTSISTQVQSEFQQKLDEQKTQLENTYKQQQATQQAQWDQKETSYKQQLSSMTETKTVTTNPKSLGIEAGYLSNSSYYGHVTYDLWGPFFFGAHTEFGGSSNAVGAGLGFRF